MGRNHNNPRFQNANKFSMKGIKKMCKNSILSEKKKKHYEALYQILVAPENQNFFSKNEGFVILPCRIPWKQLYIPGGNPFKDNRATSSAMLTLKKEYYTHQFSKLQNQVSDLQDRVLTLENEKSNQLTISSYYKEELEEERAEKRKWEERARKKKQLVEHKDAEIEELREKYKELEKKLDEGGKFLAEAKKLMDGVFQK